MNWQDAMTSQQSMLKAALVLVVLTGVCIVGCEPTRHVVPAPDLQSPYAGREVWAVAPLRNESGSGRANGVTFADELTRRLERVQGLSTLPVNRVMAAMQAMGIQEITTVDQAMALRRALNVDGLVVGTITAYDPYDPPKLGASIELFRQPPRPGMPGFDPRETQRAPVDHLAHPLRGSEQWPQQPVAAVSGYYDAIDRQTQDLLARYAHGQGNARQDLAGQTLYQRDMDRYTQFVSYALTARLIAAERRRLADTPADARPPS